jgi:hypothetical protein
MVRAAARAGMDAVVLVNSEDAAAYGTELRPMLNAVPFGEGSAHEWLSVPFADVPYDRDGVRGIQRLNAASAGRFVAAMEAAMAADPRLGAGLPMYVGHPDYWPKNGTTDPAEWLRNMPPAYGWIKGFRVSANSLDMRTEWTDEGWSLVQSKKYRFFSPLFLGADAGKENGTRIFEPRLMRSAGLVNTPNWPMPPLVNAAHPGGGTETPMTLTERIAALLGGTYADEDSLVNAAQSALGNVQTLTQQLNAATAERDTLECASGTLAERAAALETKLVAKTRLLAQTLVNAAVSRGAVLQEHAESRIAELVNAGDAFDTRASEIAALPPLMKTKPAAGDAARRSADTSERRVRVHELVNAAMAEQHISYDDAFKRVRKQNPALFGE